MAVSFTLDALTVIHVILWSRHAPVSLLLVVALLLDVALLLPAPPMSRR